MSVVDLHFHNVPNSPKVAKYAISTVSQSYKAVIASISSFSSIHVCTLVVKPKSSLNEKFCTDSCSSARQNSIIGRLLTACMVYFLKAIRVLGLLGALDPYKHKVNIGMIDQSRDASAVSLSESKSSQDSGRPVITITHHSFESSLGYKCSKKKNMD